MKSYIYAFCALLSVGCAVQVVTPTVTAQVGSETLATLNGRAITARDIEPYLPSGHATFEAQKLYALRKVAIENFITNSLLRREAARRNLPLHVLRKLMTEGRFQVLNSAVDEEYRKNARYFASMSPDEAKERLRLDLENEERIKLYKAALARLKSAAKIEIFLTEPVTPRVVIGGSGPSSRATKGRVTITEFSDFQCPYCRASQGALRRIMAEYASDVSLVFRHRPLSRSSIGYEASLAAVCAEKQGRFWEFHDALFAATKISREALGRIAADLRLDISRFNECTASEEPRAIVEADLREAGRLGINGTPTFIVNGKLHTGVIDFSEFKNIIDRELLSLEEKDRPFD